MTELGWGYLFLDFGNNPSEQYMAAKDDEGQQGGGRDTAFALFWIWQRADSPPLRDLGVMFSMVVKELAGNDEALCFEDNCCVIPWTQQGGKEILDGVTKYFMLRLPSSTHCLCEWTWNKDRLQKGNKRKIVFFVCDVAVPSSWFSMGIESKIWKEWSMVECYGHFSSKALTSTWVPNSQEDVYHYINQSAANKALTGPKVY